MITNVWFSLLSYLETFKLLTKKKKTHNENTPRFVGKIKPIKMFRLKMKRSVVGCYDPRTKVEDLNMSLADYAITEMISEQKNMRSRRGYNANYKALLTHQSVAHPE